MTHRHKELTKLTYQFDERFSLEKEQRLFVGPFTLSCLIFVGKAAYKKPVT